MLRLENTGALQLKPTNALWVWFNNKFRQSLNTRSIQVANKYGGLVDAQSN